MNTQLLSETINLQSVSQIPYISYQNLYKSVSAIALIEDRYCPIYDISLTGFFSYYPLLGFIEAIVYQTDLEVEDAQVNKKSLSQAPLWNSKKQVIQSLLKELNLEHPTILNALEKVGDFFELESQLMASDTVTHADVIRACELRSCDLRVLHCTLIQLSHQTYRPEIFDLLLPIEVISEIVADLYAYKDDIATGNYNTYWMFEKLYGKEAPHYLQLEIECYRNLFEERLKLFPENEQKFHLERLSSWWETISFISSATLIRAVASRIINPKNRHRDDKFKNIDSDS
jgi:hypothetical protein